MADNLSNYAENKLVDHLLGTTSYTMPADVYLGLGKAGSDTGITEITGGNYARELVTFDAASGGVAAIDAVVYPKATWSDTVTHVGLFDASTSGNLLVWGALSSSLTVTSGVTKVEFEAGQLTFGLS